MRKGNHCIQKRGHSQSNGGLSGRWVAQPCHAPGTLKRGIWANHSHTATERNGDDLEYEEGKLVDRVGGGPPNEFKGLEQSSITQKPHLQGTNTCIVQQKSSQVRRGGSRGGEQNKGTAFGFSTSVVFYSMYTCDGMYCCYRRVIAMNTMKRC